MSNSPSNPSSKPAINPQNSSQPNPLLVANVLPPFSSIHAEHVTPAITALVAEGRAQLQQLLETNQMPTWDSLVAQVESRCDKLDQAWAPVSHLNSVAYRHDFHTSYTESVALLTEYSTEFSQNEALYKAYQQLAD